MKGVALPRMTRYRNVSGHSGVVAYAIEPDTLWVQFAKQPVPYPYTFRSAGRALVEQAKQLAADGEDLSTFISRHLHDLYDRELRAQLLSKRRH